VELLIVIAAALVGWTLFKSQPQGGAASAPASTGTTVDEYAPSSPGPLDFIAQAIYQYEGAQPGDRNLVNLNPGNLKNAPGMTGTAGGYATFASFGDGWDALKNYIANLAAKHPDWNFFDFFTYYLGGTPGQGAPASEGNPIAYGQYVANYAGVSPTIPVSSYLGMS
jgi:hypothetical protein